MTSPLSKTMTFKLKGRLYTLMVMQLTQADRVVFSQQLLETIAQAPKLFQTVPLVLDCNALGDSPVDLSDICSCLRENNVSLVALQGTQEWVAACAKKAGVLVLNSSATQDKELFEPEIPVTPEPLPTAQFTNKTKCHSMPVRSGQQLVAKGCDLLVLGSVSPGAELLSEGHIHVYGALRGRALAGMSGDKTARIFCQSLGAELISIAGVYRLNETMESVSGPCQIYLQDDRIVIEPICLNN